MPTIPAAVTAALMASSGGLLGPSWAEIATGVGIGFSSWVAAGGVVLIGACAGGFGPVVGTTVIVIPNGGLVVSGLSSAGLVGPTAGEIAVAVSLGIASFSATTGYAGATTSGSPGGSSGTDVSKVTYADVGSLTGFLAAGLAAAGLVGPTAGQLATGLAVGIANMMMTGSGVGVVPGPGTGGSTLSKMI